VSACPGSSPRHVCDSCYRWLEQLDGTALGIFDLDLSADGTNLDLIAKLHARVLERVDLRRQIRDAQDHSIPAARPLGFAAEQRARARCARPTEQPEISEQHTRKRGKLLIDSPKAVFVVQLRTPNDVSVDSPIPVTVYIDPYSAVPIRIQDLVAESPGYRMVRLNRAIHTGDY
jgi:hypothetical protein